LCGNRGNAWGVCCRLRRIGHGALPEVLPDFES